MQTERLDAYALKRYAFTLQNTNSYFTSATIILSLAIIATSIAINFQTISNIWLPRSELPITITETMAYPEPIGSTLLCFKSNDPSQNGIPTARILSQDATVLNFPYISQENLYRIRPSLATKLATNFSCFDIGGFQFSQTVHSLIVEVMATNASLFIEASHENFIKYQQQSSFLNVTATNIEGTARWMRILRGVIDDSLMGSTVAPINRFLFDPEYDWMFSGPAQFPFQSDYSKFMVTFYLPKQYKPLIDRTLNYNVRTITVSRLGLGFIIGSVLSWISILCIICGAIAGPLMEKLVRLKTIESLFVVPPAMREPSVLKFAIAEWKKGIYQKEDAYVRMSDRLQELKDVATALKYQKTMRNITTLMPSHIETEVYACDEEFNAKYTANIGIKLHPESDIQKKKRLQRQLFDAISEKPRQSKIKQVRGKILKWMDTGSDEISITYKGSGHGSKTSVCLTLLFISSFIAFLYLFNVLSFTTQTSIYKLVNTQDYSYKFKQNQLVFSTIEEAEIELYLLDGNLQIVENVPLSSTNCLDNLTSQQRTMIVSQGDYQYCLNDSLTLVHSMDPALARSLYILNDNFQYANIAIFHIAQPSPSSFYKPANPKADLAPPQGRPSIYYELELPVTVFLQDRDQSQSFAEFSLFRQANNKLNGLTGMNIFLSSEKTVIERNSASIFDLLQTLWSLIIICFTVMLAKAARYINVRLMEERMGSIRSEFRNNLCILLSKVSSLVSGKKQREMEKARYYLKSQLKNEPFL